MVQSTQHSFLKIGDWVYNLIILQTRYFYGLCTNLCFSSAWVAWWLINKHVIFLLSRFIFACHLIFSTYTDAQLRILKFQDSVYQKAEVCAQTISEWRKSKRSVFLLRRQDFVLLHCLFLFNKGKASASVRLHRDVIKN